MDAREILANSILEAGKNMGALAPQNGQTFEGKIVEFQLQALTAAGYRILGPDELDRKFKLGDRVTKTKGSSWTGHVVGFYSTRLTLVGYAVESENEPGSVQIYPESALRRLSAQERDDAR